ncbi:MAG TPA: hypothetical protein VN031_02490 [Candidatus Microsaccharimonas sp.]|nr:hypothetical protein [Candidatus Microsaccharimonas sp.]
MDFRSAQPPVAPSAPAGQAKGKRVGDKTQMFRVGTVVLLFAATILALAAIAFLAVGKSDENQSKFVDKTKYQAVFLTNGQVYFGKVSNINHDFVRLNNIYYLTQNTTTDSKGNTTADGNYTLVKLGCQQIHDPTDEMLISQNQVSFWENLQDSGKVVTSIKQFQKQNPKGPDCSQVSNQTQASSNSSSNTQNTTTNKQ